MSSTPRRSSSGRRRTASSGSQPVLASTRIGPSKTARTASSVARSSGPPHLILRAGKSAARAARSATTSGSSMPIVKSVGGMSGDRPRISWAGRPVTLPTRSCRAMSTAQRAAPWPRMAASIARSAAARPGSSAETSPTRLEQEREDDRHRLRRLAVEPVRVALPHSDDAGKAVVAELDDDRRHASIVGVVIGPGDPERVAQAQVEGLVGQVQAHPAGDPRQGVDALADGGPEPVRPEPERVVGRKTGLGRRLGDDRPRLVRVRGRARC